MIPVLQNALLVGQSNPVILVILTLEDESLVTLPHPIVDAIILLTMSLQDFLEHADVVIVIRPLMELHCLAGYQYLLEFGMHSLTNLVNVSLFDLDLQSAEGFRV
jgi:hypothetical protein